MPDTAATAAAHLAGPTRPALSTTTKGLSFAQKYPWNHRRRWIACALTRADAQVGVSSSLLLKSVSLSCSVAAQLDSPPRLLLPNDSSDASTALALADDPTRLRLLDPSALCCHASSSPSGSGGGSSQTNAVISSIVTSPSPFRSSATKSSLISSCFFESAGMASLPPLRHIFRNCSQSSELGSEDLGLSRRSERRQKSWKSLRGSWPSKPRYDHALSFCLS